MPVPVVLIEVAPAETPAEHRQILEESCSAAVHQGTCIVASAEEPESTVAVAIVRWQDAEQRTVTVEVGVRGTDMPTWSRRSIDFNEDDALTERWTTVGLTVASLVGELPEVQALPPEEEELETPPAAAPEPTKPATKPTPRERPRTSLPPAPPPATAAPPAWSVGAYATFGTGLSDQAPRFGGSLRAAYVFWPLPLSLHVQGSFGAASAAPVSATWWTGLAGIGLIGELEPLRLGAGIRVLGGVQRFSVTAHDELTGAEASGSKAAPVLAESLELWWPARGFIAVGAGMDTWQVRHPSRVFLRGVQVSASPSVGVAAHLGARIFFR